MARHTIPEDHGQGRHRALDVILDDALEDQFDVSALAVPDGLPGTDQRGRAVAWLSNFKVQKKPGRTKTGKTVGYTVEFDRLKGESEYVFYDEAEADTGKRVKSLTTRSAGNNRVQADFDAEDPPIGKV